MKVGRSVALVRERGWSGFADLEEKGINAVANRSRVCSVRKEISGVVRETLERNALWEIGGRGRRVRVVSGENDVEVLANCQEVVVIANRGHQCSSL